MVDATSGVAVNVHLRALLINLSVEENADKAYGPKARAFTPFKHLPNHLKALTARSRSRSSIAVMPRRSLMPDRLRMKDAG